MRERISSIRKQRRVNRAGHRNLQVQEEPRWRVRLSGVTGQGCDLYETPTGGKEVRAKARVGELIRNCVCLFCLFLGFSLPISLGKENVTMTKITAAENR